MSRRLITAADVRKSAEAGNKTMFCPPEECIITPMARDEAAARGVVFGEKPLPSTTPAQDSQAPHLFQGESIVSKVCDLIKERLPATADTPQLERLVRNAVALRLGALQTETESQQDTAVSRAEGVCCINGKRLIEGAGGPIPVEEKVLVAKAIGQGENARLAGGFMAWEKASFSRVVEFQEIGVVIEGELHLSVGGKTLIGKPGDMLYFPRGISVVYSTPSSVKMACVNCVP
ncbi:MAG: hypothetical protein CVU64_00850 [Deltaproteobacteria bacterium HGW-Deltaproteobacteria-21]|jgi:ethanolamine utilization protein EutQ|nr:MAG: hypothetical protein CVU64_00850 [Deltaproteobacteria bacterium HGW-Deltaproteobacteria-21]